MCISMLIDLYKKCRNSNLWNFFCKKILNFEFNDFLYPKIFIYKFKSLDVNLEDIYNYSERFPKNKWNELAKEMGNTTYQSEHDLQNNAIFINLKYQIESLLNSSIKPLITHEKSLGKFKIKNMWFTIMKKNTSHHKHFHPKSVLSGVIYVKKRINNDGRLKILIPKNNHDEYEFQKLTKYQNDKTKLFDLRNNQTKHEIINDKIFDFNPLNNEIIIFNSYLYHWVEEYKDTDDRISIAWDSIYTL